MSVLGSVVGMAAAVSAGVPMAPHGGGCQICHREFSVACGACAACRTRIGKVPPHAQRRKVLQLMRRYGTGRCAS